MAKTNTTPEVRFAGFTEDWEERELSKILKERKVMQKITEDAPILAFAAGQGVIDRSERKSNNRDHLTHDQENKIYKLTELNDIVYNPSNLKYGAIDRNKHGRGVISPIYVTFTTEEEPSFVELLVKSEKFKLRALQFEEGTVVKRQSVKPENMLSLRVNISPSYDEQKKIGDLFVKLDNLIILNQHKSDKLMTLKKVMLEKLFPKGEKNVPEIRLKKFNSSWESKKFITIVDRISISTTKNELPRIEYEDIISGSGKFNKDINKKISSKQGIEFKSGDVVYGKLRPYLKNWFLSDFDGIAVGDFWVFRAKKINEKFIYYLIQTNHFEIISNQSTGSKMPRADWGLVSKSLFKIPSDFEEQTRIGEFFWKLDQAINLNYLELEKLKNIKKACFEKMTNTTSKHFA